MYGLATIQAQNAALVANSEAKVQELIYRQKNAAVVNAIIDEFISTLDFDGVEKLALYYPALEGMEEDEVRRIAENLRPLTT